MSDARITPRNQKAPSSRWLAATFALLLLLLLAGGAWFYRAQEQQLRREAEADLQAIADLKVSQIVGWRAERLADAAVLAHSPLFIEGVAR